MTLDPRLCAYCDGEFQPGNATQLFCRAACRKDSHRGRTPRAAVPAVPAPKPTGIPRTTVVLAALEWPCPICGRVYLDGARLDHHARLHLPPAPSPHQVRPSTSSAVRIEQRSEDRMTYDAARKRRQRARERAATEMPSARDRVLIDRPDPNPEWRDEAACRNMPIAMFFTDVGESSAPARAVCAECPVTEACREYAIGAGERHGVWGGLSCDELRRERHRVDRARRRAGA